MTQQLLFLHGFMGSRRDWESLFEVLEELDCRAIDLPGHGQGPSLPEGRPANMEWMASQVLEKIDEEFDEKIHLVGYSMGGRIALYLALHHPDRFESVVLESASPGLGGEAKRRARRELDARRGGQMIDEGLVGFLRRWYEMPLFGNLSRQPQFEAMLARRLAGDVDDYGRVIVEMSPGAQLDLWPRLGELKIPSLWVAGGEDEKYVGVVEEAVKKTPGAVGEVVAGAGHNVHMSAPRRFGALLRNHPWADAG